MAIEVNFIFNRKYGHQSTDAGTCDFFVGKEPKNRAKLLISANIRPKFRLNVVFFVILQSFREYNKNHYNERFLQMA